MLLMILSGIIVWYNDDISLYGLIYVGLMRVGEMTSYQSPSPLKHISMLDNTSLLYYLQVYAMRVALLLVILMLMCVSINFPRIGPNYTVMYNISFWENSIITTKMLVILLSTG